MKVRLKLRLFFFLRCRGSDFRGLALRSHVCLHSPKIPHPIRFRRPQPLSWIAPGATHSSVVGHWHRLWMPSSATPIARGCRRCLQRLPCRRCSPLHCAKQVHTILLLPYIVAALLPSPPSGNHMFLASLSYYMPRNTELMLSSNQMSALICPFLISGVQ